MSKDLIRRSDAIKAINESCFLDEIEEAIYELPTIEPKCGKWIPHKQENGKTVLWKCSECGQIIFSETETDRLEFQKWCSRCGARMKGADDEASD